MIQQMWVEQYTLNNEQGIRYVKKFKSSFMPVYNITETIRSFTLIELDSLFNIGKLHTEW